MDQQEARDMQRRIIAALDVPSSFDAKQEVERRVTFLTRHLIDNARNALVLGISGGVDSSVAGRLAQLACERAREQGHRAEFIAMRLPYGEQADESDAQRALDFIRPDRRTTVNIKPAADAMLASLREGGMLFTDDNQQDFVLGNIKARQRMIAQYALAGTHAGLVIGTDHAAEAVMGFFTKYGDGACDLTPLSGLNKRRVRELALALGATQDIAHKVPTADLETLTPQRPDEDAYGITYAQIDDFLEGKPVSNEVYTTIKRFYEGSAHKRALPIEAPRK